MDCQVEVDTAKYYRLQEQMEAAQEAAQAAAEAQVNDPESAYFWADNMLEALCEADTPRHSMKDGMTYQQQLSMLISSFQYEAHGKLCEKISKEYWTTWLLEMTC